MKLKRSCPVCQSGEGVYLYHQDFILFDGHPLTDGYDLVSCQTCNFTFADTAVTQADLDIYYEQLSRYEDNKTSTGGGESGLDAIRLDKTVADITRVVTNKEARILDIGCANGGLLKRLLDKGYTNMVGVDPSPVCAQNTRNLTGKKAYAASLYHIPAEAGTFDLIIVSHVLEHLFDLQTALCNFAALLNPNGIIYAECPDAASYAQVIHAPFQEINTEHINHFSRISFQNLFSAFGFTKITDGIRSFLIPSGLPYTAVYGFYQKAGTVGAKYLEKDAQTLAAIQDYLTKSAAIFNRMDEKIKELSAKSELLVWGTGQLTMKLLANSSLKDANIKAFIDSSPINTGKQLLGKPILHPSRLKENDTAEAIILITSTIYEDAIRQDISERFQLPNPVEGLKQFLT